MKWLLKIINKMFNYAYFRTIKLGETNCNLVYNLHERYILLSRNINILGYPKMIPIY